jgi:hypothetical protein
MNQRILTPGPNHVRIPSQSLGIQAGGKGNARQSQAQESTEAAKPTGKGGLQPRSGNHSSGVGPSENLESSNAYQAPQGMAHEEAGNSPRDLPGKLLLHSKKVFQKPREGIDVTPGARGPAVSPEIEGEDGGPFL